MNELHGRTSVAFQGMPGAFSEEAIAAFFGERDVDVVGMPDFDAVARAVAAGDVDFGVLPVENSIAGDIPSAHEAVDRAGLTTNAEVTIPIRQFFLGIEGARLDLIRRILSHPVALAQCRDFLESLPLAQTVEMFDTAGAAQEVSTLGNPLFAAIASLRAATHYHLAVLAADIQDTDDNRTRFILIGP